MLTELEQKLSDVVGDDLAHTLINFAQRPTDLEAEILRGDDVAKLNEEQRHAVLAILSQLGE